MHAQTLQIEVAGDLVVAGETRDPVRQPVQTGTVFHQFKAASDLLGVDCFHPETPELVEFRPEFPRPGGSPAT